MSNIQNTKWIESARENFDQALSEGNLELANDIMCDTGDAGFETYALFMHQELNAATAKAAEKILKEEEESYEPEDSRDYNDRMGVYPF